MEEYLSLEVLILMLLMSFIKNKDVNKDGKENKDKAVVVAVLLCSHFILYHSL